MKRVEEQQLYHYTLVPVYYHHALKEEEEKEEGQVLDGRESVVSREVRLFVIV
jgi:hypothetical protein